MEKEQFVEFLKNHVLTIFTGSEIVDEEPSTTRDTIVAMGTGGTLLVKLHKTDEYRLVIKKLQPFKHFEINLVKTIITELLFVYTNSQIQESYLPVLQNHIVEKAICKSMNDFSYETMFSIISELTKWSNRTYEGQRALFGFLVSNHKAPKNINPNLHVSKILNENFGAVVADGINTCFKISSDGYLLDFVNIKPTNTNNLNAPLEYVNMASICHGNKVGISLTENGDILVFHDKSLVFTKKCGTWNRYSHEEIIDRIASKSSEIAELNRKALYVTSLDVSFARTGGCVVHLNKDEEQNVLKHIDITDILLEEYYNIKLKQPTNFLTENIDNNEPILNYEDFLLQDKCTKIANLRHVINGKKFYELSRKLRQELVGVDGATVIGNDGSIIAVGSIIIIESSGFGGGRLAASKTLSKYGVSLKISADGPISCFKFDKHKQTSMPIFMLG